MSRIRSDSRRVHAGSNTVFSIIGAAVILIAVNYLGMRHYVRADWTSSGIYTLSDKTLKMLKSLEKEVRLYVLWNQDDPKFADVKELISRYTAASSKVKMEIVDRDRNPERFKWIIDRYGAKIQDFGGGRVEVEASVVVISGENVKFISSADFTDYQEDMTGEEAGNGQELSGYKAEQAVSSAVLNVTSDRHQTICFTQGHDEWPFDGVGGQSLATIKEGLVQDGYKAKAIATTSTRQVPSECDAVVVAGPQRGFLEHEKAQLDEYLKNGGRLLLLMDPVIGKDGFEAVGLEGLTAAHGIVLQNDVVLETDMSKLVNPSQATFLASEFTFHDAVKQFSIPDSVGADVKEQISAIPVVFSMVRSLVLNGADGAVAEPLAKTSKESWGETDVASMGSGETAPEKGNGDNPGPVVIAASSTVRGTGAPDKAGRLIVVGDSDFLNGDLFVHAGLSNRDFWSGLLGWLTERQDLISISPKNIEHVQLNLTTDDIWTMVEIVGFEVLFIVVLGVLVWKKRRR